MLSQLQPHLSELRVAARVEPLGLYLHFPFCKDRCTYCSFVTIRDEGLHDAVVQRLESGLETWGTALARPQLDTLYFGGGTPSLLTGEELARLTAAVHRYFDLTALEEATLEANPGTLNLEGLRAMRDLGWDRLSLGIQTLDDELLRRLGRIHDGAEGLKALEMAQRAGFERLSGDLMVGIPGQSLDRVLGDARRLVEAGATHLSIYLLDLDKACPLKAQVEGGRLQLPSEDEVADVFEALQAELPSLGLQPYEISNYGAPGEASRHNLRYWQRRPYLGLGPSAASQIGAFRWTESGIIPAWVEGRGTPEVQELDAAEALAEVPLLGFRMHEGVDWQALRSRAESENLLPLVEAWETQLEPLIRGGLVLREASRLKLSARGMLLSNGVFQIFV